LYLAMKIHIETMGCQMNRLDSELLVGALLRAGHEVVESPSLADAVLYNTCSVRAQAENKVYSRLGVDRQRKQAGKALIVGVMGCLAQRLGERLLEMYPQVDLICGPGQLKLLPELLERAAGGERAIALDGLRDAETTALPADDFDSLDCLRRCSDGSTSAQAFVRVSRGCDNFCTYCIVPFVRGAEIHRPSDRIGEEVRRLVQAGKTEITLLGQAVNKYRYAAGDRTIRFADLLEMLSGIAGLRRLRFVTSHPIGMGVEILQAMRDLPNVCPYLHLPAQSGSDAVLKRMNRGYSRSQYDDLIDSARKTVPGLSIAGDFIVGFPGETEPDHQASADLILKTGYKNSFIFKYSPRPGTSAAKNLSDDVPGDVKRRRNAELLAVQSQVGLEHHRQFVGRRVEILVEGLSPHAGRNTQVHRTGLVQLTGRTTGDHIVVFDGPEELVGWYVEIDVSAATALTLTGSIPQKNP